MKEKFKEFVKANPRLINYVKDNNVSWQSLYEIYALYGEDEIIWNKYVNSNSSLTDDLVNIIKNINYDEIDKFYRIGKYPTETFNDSSWYGYAGATSFSSMEYRQIAKLMNDLGLSSNKINKERT